MRGVRLAGKKVALKAARMVVLMEQHSAAESDVLTDLKKVDCLVLLTGLLKVAKKADTLAAKKATSWAVW